MRFVHVNGASIVFLLFYLHLLKGIAYCSFRFGRELVWLSGFAVFLFSCLIAFTGYSLVWGQMSFWALTVITNLVTAIPVVGFDLLEFIWSSVVIGTFTLRRFYVIHFLMPFVCLGLVLVHLLVVHRNYTKTFLDLGGIAVDKVLFGVFIVKDLCLFLVIVGVVLVLSLSSQVKVLIHPDNFLRAMVFVTPSLIEPEWYFLTYYAVLRSFPHKLLGVICLVGSLLLIGLVVVFNESAFYQSFVMKVELYVVVSLLVSLGYLSMCPLVYPFSFFAIVYSIVFMGQLLWLG